MPIHEPHFAGLPAKIKSVTGVGYPPAQIRKAIAGGLAGALPLFAADIVDLHISRLEGGGLAAAFVLGVLAVFNIRNAPADPPGDGE